MSHQFHFLLVEDNPDHAELVKSAFETKMPAHRPHWVRSGADAVTYLRLLIANSQDLPQLILLDLNLPKISGLEVLKYIKANEDLKSIPVVVLTASEAEKDRQQAYECQAHSYVVKPIDGESLNSIAQYLENCRSVCNPTASEPAPANIAGSR